MSEKPTVGLVVWNKAGTRIAHHVVWTPNPDMDPDEFIRNHLMPTMWALECKVGEKLFPKLGQCDCGACDPATLEVARRHDEQLEEEP